MTAHVYHPDSHEHGLADDCPRCDEHAEHPLRSLDGRNLASLVERVTNGMPARSVNEGRAMAVVRDAMSLGHYVG